MKTTWLIDLDNTLHNASHAVFPAIYVNMNQYIAQLLGDGITPADETVVNATRSHYWKKYGATVLGLTTHHQVDPYDFLHQTHQLDDLPTLMRYETGLRRLLSRLPGRKILFTNAPRHYAEQVVQQLGLHRHFDHKIWIESMRVHGRLRPKPSRWLLKKVLAKHQCHPHQCVLIEDTLDNLRTAKQLGLKTVWITQYLNLHKHPKANRPFSRSHFVDLKVRSVKQIPSRMARIVRPFAGT